jgi:zinc/manganese transport system substrate-binding protein
MRVSILTLILGSWFLGQAASPALAAEPKRLRIVTTIVPLYSWVAQVVGEHADVENLLPRDVGPHNYSFRPRDLRKLQNADIIVQNGLGLENWLEKAIENTGGKQRLVQTTAGLESQFIYDVPTLKLDPDASASKSDHDHDHDHGHSHGHHHHHGDHQPNPHLWLDPIFACHGVTNILNALVAADPHRASFYRENAQRYVERLHALDRDLTEALDKLSVKTIVTYHDAFPYFTRRYGLELVGVVEQIPSVDPSPRYLADLMKVIRARDVKVIFTEPQFNTRLAKRLKQDLSVSIAELDVLETGKLSPNLYEEGMRRNLRTLADLLK